MKEKIKILCAEDDFDIRSNISDILRDEGYEVFEAEDGKIGFEVFTKTEPDLVISDIMMPNNDGYDLLKMIRSSHVLHNHAVPFIFLSALGQKENILRGIDNLANDYLIKPVDFDLLISKVREKTHNAELVSKHHGRNLENIKNHISEILPYEIFVHLNSLSQVVNFIKSEPYGKIDDRYRLELEKFDLQASRLRYLINNNLDKEVIERRLKSKEEILTIYEVFEAAINSLADYSKMKIEIERPSEIIEMSKIRIDKSVINEVLIKIFTSVFSCDANAKITISFLIDHFDQLAVIFYLNSASKRFNECIQEREIKKMLDCQACRFDVVLEGENAAIITIPSYRLC